MSVEEKDARKVMYCAMSLYNIANDLKEINPMVSNICLSMSKNLIAEMKKLEIPDAICIQRECHITPTSVLKLKNLSKRFRRPK